MESSPPGILKKRIQETSIETDSQHLMAEVCGCAHSNGSPICGFVKANSDHQSHKNVHSSGSPTCGHCSCTEPRSCTGTILASVSKEARYKENRESSNGNEPIAAAETGQHRVDHNSAYSVSATDDEDDDNDWTTKQPKKKKTKGIEGYVWKLSWWRDNELKARHQPSGLGEEKRPQRAQHQANLRPYTR